MIDGAGRWAHCELLSLNIMVTILITTWQAEFDSPAQLLRNEKGRLRALVDESKDKDILVAMANSAAGASTL